MNIQNQWLASRILNSVQMEHLFQGIIIVALNHALKYNSVMLIYGVLRDMIVTSFQMKKHLYVIQETPVRNVKLCSVIFLNHTQCRLYVYDRTGKNIPGEEFA